MLSDNIRNYRKENNMSQDELAEKLGVSRQSISLWETGQTQPTIDNIIALAKIFNVSSDEILKDTDSVCGSIKSSQGGAPQKNNKANSRLAIIIAAVAVIVIGIVSVSVILGGRLFGKTSSADKTVNNSSVQSGSSQTDSITSRQGSESAVSATSKAGSPKTGTSSVKSNVSTASKSVTAGASSAAAKTESPNFDLFSYCKDFAIKKGKLNGDYTMYQQPAEKYGGYKDEYFSISYWGDSNMVEFCLHCPLNDTYSINFYLRMRGGYNKKYEYLTSYYYRDNGESVKSATGYIDPAVFSDNYPLNCDKYEGNFNEQNKFMEDSRVGICDLIHCLKKFAETENMECGFSAFDFVNF